MKLMLISLCLTGALCVASGQSSASAPSAGQATQRSGSTTYSRESVEEQLKNARAEETELLANYRPESAKVAAVRRRINELERQRTIATAQNTYATAVAQNAYGTSSSVRYGQRLNNVVRRANTLSAGSIILNTPLKSEEIDELAEDLNVFKFLITRQLERTFGDQATEYRLGVPITMGNSRMVQLDYLQDFGLLVKVFVPFPVTPGGAPEKKVETPSRPDTEWEKARRALYGGETDHAGNVPGADPSTGLPSAPAYDEKLVTELKTQMFQALKNAGNLRHIDDQQTIILAIIGGQNPTTTTIDPLTGLPLQNADAGRSTVLTIRVIKGAAVVAAKDEKNFDNFVKEARVVSYTDSVSAASTQPMSGFGGGGYGMFPSATLPTATAR